MPLVNFKQISWVILLSIGSFACTPTTNVKSTKTDTQRAELYLQLGARYMEMGMLQEAKDKLNKALELDDRNPNTHNALGVFAQRIQRNEEARRHFNKALLLKPDDVGIQNNFGSFLCQNGNYDEGMKLLQQAAKTPLNKHLWFAYTNIGLCHKTKNEQEAAEMAFRQALHSKPDYAPALLEMQRLSFDKGQYISARAFLERYLGVATHSEQSLWLGIQTERALGNKELAENYRQQLLTNFPASASAQQLRQSSGVQDREGIR